MGSLVELARRTPPSRERYVDFLRALSILVVVFGHWLMAVITWSDGSFEGRNALDTVGGMWALTWVLQVMPLFFFVGGFSNHKTYLAMRRNGLDYVDYLSGRIGRLMKPTIVFIVLWTLAAPVVESMTGGGTTFRQATQLVGVPLWFLGVYLVVIAVAPPMLRLHQRFGVWAVAGLAGAVAVVDIARLAFEVPFVGFLNFAFVWLFAHQLGFFYADGALQRLGRRVLLSAAAAGLASLLVLTNIGIYSRSMVGVTDGAVSNNAPPSVCIVALTVWLVGLAMFFRPVVSRSLEKERLWAGVIGVNSVIMTIFLWHLTAMLIAVVVLYPLGWPQSPAGSAEWWLLRPVWAIVLTVALVPLVALFGRFERPTRSPIVQIQTDKQGAH